jgi:hypothetical protein
MQSCSSSTGGQPGNTAKHSPQLLGGGVGEAEAAGGDVPEAAVSIPRS